MTLYLLSGPQTNRIGLFYLSVVSAADDLNWTPLDARTRLDAVCAAFDWLYDSIASVIWIPSWWDWNTPTENEKNMRGALSDLSDVPTTALIGKFASHVIFVPESLHKLFRDVLERHQRRTPTEHRANTDPKIVPQDKTRQDQIRQDQTETERHVSVQAATRTPDRSETRTAALVPQSSHRNHALCGLVCLPSALFEDFVKRARHRPEPEKYVTTFFREWCARYDSGDRKANDIGGDTFDFWRARWKETHPEKPVETATEKAEAILARRRGQT